MEVKIFYSWQSDLPNSTNRGFIEAALEKVAKSIHQDDSIQVQPVVDRDTQGVAGAPDIANAIFDKIKNCQIFVCDVSIINQGSDRRLAPNPNVLVELGYALGILGWERVVLVINTAFGTIESLPFDLRMRRVINYELPQEIEKINARRELEGKLKTSLITIVAKIESSLAEETVAIASIYKQAIDAVETAQPNAALLTQKYLSWLLQALDSLFPSYKGNARLDLMLSSDNEKTQQLIAEFSSLANSVALTKNSEIASIIYDFFSKFCERYNYPNDYFGQINRSEHDFYRFLGYEMFVCFISAFVKNNQWSAVDKLLKQSWHISNPYGKAKPASMTFEYASSSLKSFDLINTQNNLNHVSLFANVLKMRHCKEPLSKVVSAKEFMEADILLWLRQKDNITALSEWKPYSCLYLEDEPQYLSKTVSRQFAEQLLPAFNVPDISSFRTHLSQRMENAKELNRNTLYPFLSWANTFDLKFVGTRA